MPTKSEGVTNVPLLDVKAQPPDAPLTGPYPTQDASGRRAATTDGEGSDEPFPVTRKDLYQTLQTTRNLEIGLFWQRSNYFLVLNTGIAFGYFNLVDHKYTLIFAIMGVVASTLWFRVCLGGKFWQTR